MPKKTQKDKDAFIAGIVHPAKRALAELLLDDKRKKAVAEYSEIKVQEMENFIEANFIKEKAEEKNPDGTVKKKRKLVDFCTLCNPFLK